MPSKSPLPATWDVPEEIRNRFGERAGRQRAMFAEGHLVLVFHVPPKADENERLARLYWRKPDGSWSSTESAGGASTVAKHLDEYRMRIEAIDRVVDSSQLANEYFAVMSQLSPLLRSTRNLHKSLQDAREEAGDDPEIITYRDRAYELERTADLLDEDAKNGLDFAVARRAEEQALAGHRMETSAHRLNLLAAFFFPLATLSTIFGVNLVHGLENLYPPYTFMAFLLVGILLGGMLTLFVSMNLPTREGSRRKTPYDKRI